jgi:hypothetical protein
LSFFFAGSCRLGSSRKTQTQTQTLTLTQTQTHTQTHRDRNRDRQRQRQRQRQSQEGVAQDVVVHFDLVAHGVGIRSPRCPIAAPSMPPRCPIGPSLRRCQGCRLPLPAQPTYATQRQIVAKIHCACLADVPDMTIHAGTECKAGWCKGALGVAEAKTLTGADGLPWCHECGEIATQMAHQIMRNPVTITPGIFMFVYGTRNICHPSLDERIRTRAAAIQHEWDWLLHHALGNPTPPPLPWVGHDSHSVLSAVPDAGALTRIREMASTYTADPQVWPGGDWPPIMKWQYLASLNKEKVFALLTHWEPCAAPCPHAPCLVVLGLTPDMNDPRPVGGFEHGWAVGEREADGGIPVVAPAPWAKASPQFAPPLPSWAGLSGDELSEN